MYKFYKENEIDFEKYERLLRYRPYIVYDRDTMERTLRYELCRAETIGSLAVDEMIYRSGGACFSLSRNVILTYLMQYERCPERYFYNHKTQDASLDAKKVLQKLVQNGYAEEFLERYMEYKSLVSKNGKIRGIITNNAESADVNKDGVALSKLYFSVNQQKNLRYNYKDSDIIAIPKEYNHCITVDNGYFLAWGDFGQSDFRIAYNLFMRSEENDQIMNAYDDKYEALARMVASYENTTFDYDKFKEERQLYKKLTLATVYGTRDSVVPAEKPFVQRMTEFLYKCPKYVEYEKRLRNRIGMNVPLVLSSYFGNQQIISGKYRDVDLLNDALNAPVQTGTSEIVALTTMSILEEFYKLGYSEEDISVYYVRHDEPVFRIHERVLKDIWVLKQFNQILIDDWTPLLMNFNFGYYYKRPDEELEQKVEAIYEENQNKIVSIEPGNTINDFYPVAPVFMLAIEKIATPDNKFIYCLYSEELNAVQYNLLASAVEDESDYVLSIIDKFIVQVYEKGYRGMRIRTNFISNGDAFLDNTYISFECVNDNSLSKAALLARYMYCRYASKNGFGFEERLLPHKSDEEFVNSVKNLGDVLNG